MNIKDLHELNEDDIVNISVKEYKSLLKGREVLLLMNKFDYDLDEAEQLIDYLFARMHKDK